MARKRQSPPHEGDFARFARARVAEIPNCEIVDTAVLAPGPSTYKVAMLLQFRNLQTGRPTHRELHLNDFPFRVYGGVKWAVKDRLAHWACSDEELQRLEVFLASREPAGFSAGEDAAGPADPEENVQDRNALAMPRSSDGLKAWMAGLSFAQLATVVAALGDRCKELRILPAGGEADARRRTAAALRAAHRATGLINLRQLVDRKARPAEFRRFLESHAWMLGRLYVRQLADPALPGDLGEMLLLRTADGGLDLVLLMPIDAPLLADTAADDPAVNNEGGQAVRGQAARGQAARGQAARGQAAGVGARESVHGSRQARPGGPREQPEPLYVSAPVSRAVAYAAACVAELTDRASDLLTPWRVSPSRVTARIVLGCVDPTAPRADGKRHVLREFNDRLAGIEVVGYDRLVQIAEDVLEADLAECGGTHDAPHSDPQPRRPLI
jgi:hypothetical protein